MASSSDYQLGDKLGEGAFGIVYRAKYTRDCALKVIDISNLLGEEKFAKKQEWKKEVNALIKVRGHDNIVEYRNSFADTKDKLWVEMEYCNGGTFNDYVMEKKPGNATKHRFMMGISSGVAFLHAQGVVHRDLKPENMISIDEDNVPHAKVADFGLAKVIASCHNEGQMLQYYLTSGCGTEFFMAPEVYDGHYTEKADVFSMGIIFNTMIPSIVYKTIDGKIYLLMWLSPDFSGGMTGYPQGIPYGRYIHEKDNGLSYSHTLEGKVSHQVIQLLNSMIEKKYNDRPSAEEVVTTLRSISPKELSLLAQPPTASP